jgi:CRISPR/Cas system-associated protein Cas7 (RAMP superfamily)
MAPHGKQMTPEEKQIIVALSQQGYSQIFANDVGHIANSFMANDCTQMYMETPYLAPSGLFFFYSEFSFEKTSIEHSDPVWCQLVQWFQRKRLKCKHKQ